MDIGGYWRRIGGSDDVGRAWVTWEKRVGLNDASVQLTSSGSWDMDRVRFFFFSFRAGATSHRCHLGTGGGGTGGGGPLTPSTTLHFIPVRRVVNLARRTRS